LQQVTGTAVLGVQYQYSLEQDGGCWRQCTVETKLDSAGTATAEWVKTYQDGAGNNYKTAYPDGASSQSWFNSEGRLWKQRDPDNVVTLYLRNSLTESDYAYTITALTASTTNINSYSDLRTGLATILGGNDRVSQTQRSYQTGGGKPDRVQTDTFVWATNTTSSILVARSENSVDGLQSWQTVWRTAGNDSTKAVSSSATAYNQAIHCRESPKDH